MPTPFDTWTAQEAKKTLGNRSIPTEHGLFFSGDHWQSGNGWVGPKPTGDMAAEVQFALNEIERAFVSQNAIKEVVERAASGVTAREIAWSLVPRRRLAQDEAPTAQESALALEAETALSEWVDLRNAADILRETTQVMLWAGRGPFRLFVPVGELDGGGRVPRADLLTSMRRVYLHENLAPETTGVVRDARTQREAGIHTYTDESNKEFTELAYVDDAGNTLLRVLGASGEGAWLLPLGGRLPVYEMQRKPLITNAMVSLQKLMNLALTMMQRNVIQGGFLERVFLNAQLPGKFEIAADGTRSFVPDPLYVGAGTTNALVGITTTDSQGITHVANPNVIYRDPVSVATFRDTKNEAYTGILAEAHQLHYAMSSDATASGESRKTAMADYIVDLLLTKAQVERGWAWMLETTLAMAAVFAGTPGRYDELRISCQAQLDAGPISTDWGRVAIDLVREEIISRQTAMSWVGVDDPAAEAAQIAEEQDVQPTQPQGAQDEIESLFSGVTAQEQRNGADATATNGTQPQNEGVNGEQ